MQQFHPSDASWLRSSPSNAAIYRVPVMTSRFTVPNCCLDELALPLKSSMSSHLKIKSKSIHPRSTSVKPRLNPRKALGRLFERLAPLRRDPQDRRYPKMGPTWVFLGIESRRFDRHFWQSDIESWGLNQEHENWIILNLWLCGSLTSLHQTFAWSAQDIVRVLALSHSWWPEFSWKTSNTLLMIWMLRSWLLQVTSAAGTCLHHAEPGRMLLHAWPRWTRPWWSLCHWAVDPGA